ncbi:hypothetical protein Tsubulata_031870, partial [Turnera subulata]
SHLHLSFLPQQARPQLPALNGSSRLAISHSRSSFRYREVSYDRQNEHRRFISDVAFRKEHQKGIFFRAIIYVPCSFASLFFYVLKPRRTTFKDWISDSSFGSERHYPIKNGYYERKAKPAIASIWNFIGRGWDNSVGRIKSLKKPLSSLSGDGVDPEEEAGHRKKVLDPQGPFLQKWNKIFMLACVLSVSLDPLFFYIPWVNGEGQDRCLDWDKRMAIIACVLRTFIDAIYILRIIFQFRTGFIAPSSRVFGRGELVEDPALIARRYLTSNFVIDVLSILPLPQIVVLIILPLVDGPVPLAAKNLLRNIIFIQYLPRIIRVYPVLYKEITLTSGILTETAWLGAAFNLFLYMLASHIAGALWYLLAIEREDRCWSDVCKKEDGCDTTYLYCGNHRHGNNTFLTASCPFINPDDIKDPSVFNFGIFNDALKSGVMESKDFPQKFFYCFWWGLRNLSSLGQSLNTSTFVGEITFAIFICIFGLVEEMRVKRRDAEQWMSHRMLPDDLKKRVRRYEQYRWQETRGVEERVIIRNLPKDLRRDINHHLSFNLLKKVPMFEKMDEKILDAVCDRLKPALFTKDSYIVREGDPVDEMLFIMRGNLVSATTNGGKTGFFNAATLKAGDFCGEGLLTWALDPQSSPNLPISTRTVQALTEWRTWAACFIQSAWRRYYKRKQAKSLSQAEGRLQHDLVDENGSLPSLGVAIYASKFAANALRNLRQGGPRTAAVPQTLALLPRKPSEPDFSSPNHT